MYMATSPKDAYAVLGVDPAADDATIAAAYRVLARRFHPDIAGESATRRMMRINAAWDMLRSPTRREAYDQELAEVDPARAAAARRRPYRARPASWGHERPSGSSAASSTRTDGAGTTGAAGSWTPERPSQRDGTGAAGRPPGRPSGTVLPFGRHLGWSLGEIARVDPGYLVWLEERPEGRPYLEEIDGILRRSGFRTNAEPEKKKGRFGR